MIRVVSAGLVVAALVADVAAEPFERDPGWWVEMGGGYGQSMSTEPVADRAHLPVVSFSVLRVLGSRLALAGELDLPVPLSPDGGFAAGVGLALTLPLTAPVVVDAGEITAEPRQFRSRLELVVRGTGGWAAIYNDVSEGYISTSERSFQGSGLYVRALAGVRWRLDNDRGRLTSLGVGLYPSVTALRADYSRPSDAGRNWRIAAGLSFLASLGF